MSLNKVILVGNLGADPEVRHTESGAVANFSIATNETYKNKEGEKVTNTEWHRIVVWGKLAEIVEKWVEKGMQVIVEGKLQTRSWEDKDGNKRYTTEINCRELRMLGGKSDNQDARPKKEEQVEEAEVIDNEEEDDDLPF